MGCKNDSKQSHTRTCRDPGEHSNGNLIEHALSVVNGAVGLGAGGYRKDITIEQIELLRTLIH